MPQKQMTQERRPDPHFARQLEGWRLATAEITYRMPDHKNILQIFIWQAYDLSPEFPRLRRFLDHWSHHLDGPLCSVRVACQGKITSVDLPHVNQEWCLLH